MKTLTDAIHARDVAISGYLAAVRSHHQALGVLRDLNEQDVAGNDPRVEAALLAQQARDAAHASLKQATAVIDALLASSKEATRTDKSGIKPIKAGYLSSAPEEWDGRIHRFFNDVESARRWIISRMTDATLAEKLTQAADPIGFWESEDSFYAYYILKNGE